MVSKNPNVEIFNRDAADNAGYLYTHTDRLSSRLATQRSADAILASGIFASKTVIDIGCGDGHFTRQFCDSANPRSIVGIDAAAEAIRVATERRGDRPIRFEVGDAHCIAMPDNSFDVALIQSILHHDDQPWDIIREAFRLAPVILIHEPNGNNPGLKIIEKLSPYHREHGEKSFFSWQLTRWINQCGARVTYKKFAGFVAMFSPDWLARTMKTLEPFLEATPILNALGCSAIIMVGERIQVTPDPEQRRLQKL